MDKKVITCFMSCIALLRNFSIPSTHHNLIKIISKLKKKKGGNIGVGI